MFSNNNDWLMILCDENGRREFYEVGIPGVPSLKTERIVQRTFSHTPISYYGQGRVTIEPLDVFIKRPFKTDRAIEGWIDDSFMSNTEERIRRCSDLKKEVIFEINIKRRVLIEKIRKKTNSIDYTLTINADNLTITRLGFILDGCLLTGVTLNE